MDKPGQPWKILVNNVELMQREIFGAEDLLSRNRLLATISLLGYLLVMICFSLFFLSNVVRLVSFSHFPTFAYTLLLIAAFAISMALLISGLSSNEQKVRKHPSMSNSETAGDPSFWEEYYLTLATTLAESQEQLTKANERLVKKIRNSFALTGGATIAYLLIMVFRYFH